MPHARTAPSKRLRDPGYPRKLIGMAPAFALAVLLGGLGYGLSLASLDLGGSVHLIFGNAVAYLALRTLGTGPTILAVSIASLRTVALWHHPWAWGIWTAEAAFVCLAGRRLGPIVADLVFWAVIGAPALWATYGLAMGMDLPSLALTVAKQATNGIVNVMLAELGYLAVQAARGARVGLRLPSLPARDAMMAVLLGFTLIPALVFAVATARRVDEQARTQLRTSVVAATKDVRHNLETWVGADSGVLRLAPLLDRFSTGDGSAGGFPAPEFRAVFLVSPDGRVKTVHGSAPHAGLDALALRDVPDGPVRVAAVCREDASCLGIKLALPRESGGGYVLGVLLEDAFDGIVRERENDQTSFFVFDGSGHLVAGTPGLASARLADALRTGGPAALVEGVELDTVATFGNSAMNQRLEALMVAGLPLGGGPDAPLFLLAAMEPRAQFLAARTEQQESFRTVAAFVALSVIVASLISAAMGRALQRTAGDIAALAGIAGNTPAGGGQIEELKRLSVGADEIASLLRRLREEAASNQERLRLVTAQAPLVIYALEVSGDAKGRPTYVSASVERVLGYTREEVAQPGWWSHAIHPEDSEATLAAVARLEDGRTIAQEYRLRTKDGRFVWVYDTLMRSGDEAVGALLDISDRREAQQQLLQAAKLIHLGEMATGMAHELNQPLNTIKLSLANLRAGLTRGVFDQQAVDTKIDRISRSVDRAALLISHMRMFGRASRGSDAFDVGASVTRALTVAEHHFRSLDAEIACRIEGTPETRGETGMLEQVIVNLLLNARDAIAARRRSDPGVHPKVTIEAARNGDTVLVSVADNGGGIDPAVLPRIFEPFFTTRDPGQGTGLGLSISYGIVQEMGGTLTAENVADGARFTICLPAASHATAEAALSEA